MNEHCVRAVVWLETNITDSLDKYVVFCFLICFILCFLLVILLTRYIFLQLKRQKVKEDIIRERNIFPYKLECLKDDVESDGSDVWSVSVEESNDYCASNRRNVKYDVDNNKYIYSQQLDFETCYVEADNLFWLSPKKDRVYNEYLYNSYATDMLQLYCGKLNTIPKPISLLSLAFTGTKSIDSAWRCNQLLSSIIVIVAHRLNAFHQVLIFLLQALCHCHIISEDSTLKIQSNYEQALEECRSHSEIKKFFYHGGLMQQLICQFEDDIQKYSDTSAKELQNFDNIPKLFYDYHLDCVKLYLSLVESYCKVNNKCQTTIHDFTVGLKKVISLSNYRILFFLRAIKKTKHDEFVFDEFVNKSISLLDVFISLLKSELNNDIRKLDCIKLEKIDKLNTKHEKEEKSLRFEFLEKNELKVKEKVLNFQKYLTALFMEHENERMQLLEELIECDIKNFNKIVMKQQRMFIEEISALEESIISSLHRKSNLSETQLLEITQQLQVDYENFQKNFETVKEEILKEFTSDIDKKSIKFATFCDFLIKQVSSNYKFCLSSLSVVLNYLPSINDKTTDALTSSLKEKLNAVVFDVVIALLFDVMHVVYGEDDYMSLEKILAEHKSELSASVMISEEWVTSDVQTILQLTIKPNEMLLDELYMRWHTSIKSFLEEKVLCLFQKEVNKFLHVAVLSHNEKHVHVYKTVQDLLKKLDNTVKEPNDSFRRKGSSFHRKSKNEEFREEYNSHLNMKHNKFADFCKQKEKYLFKTLVQKKNTSLSINQSCLSVLELQSQLIALNSFDYLQQLFEFEHHYMIERLMKKIYLFSDSIEFSISNTKNCLSNGQSRATKPNIKEVNPSAKKTYHKNSVKPIDENNNTKCSSANKSKNKLSV